MYIGALEVHPFRLMKLNDFTAKALEESTNEYKKVKMPRQDQLMQFRYVYKQMPDDLRVLLERGLLDQAYFLYVYAMDTGWRFLVSMEKALRPYDVTFKGQVKTNLKRISQNIIGTVILGEGESQCVFRVTDMLRGQITVKDAKEMIEMYKVIEEQEEIHGDI